jgi:hypothetical protein
VKAYARSLTAEFDGTALLLFVIVGSGIALANLTNDGAMVLIGHAIAAGAPLTAQTAIPSGHHVVQ